MFGKKGRARFPTVMILIIVLAPLTIGYATGITSATTPVSGWLHTEGRWIKDSQGNIIRLNGANAYIRLQNQLAKFQNAAAYGFNTIRLAFWKNDIEHPIYDYPNVDKSGIAAIDRAVNWSTQLGLRIILDQHFWASPYGGYDSCWPAPGEFLSNATLQQQWLSVWEFVVDRYKNNPTVAGIDIMNEPYNMMDGSGTCPGSKGVSVGNPWSVWEGIAKYAVADLKTHNPNLLFIVEGWTGDHPWKDTAFLKEGNVVLSDHIYYNSHMGWADWAKAYASGTIAAGKQLLDKFIENTYMSYVYQGIPVWVGETGFLMMDLNWQQEMADEMKLFDQRGIGYSVYTYAAWPWNERFDLTVESQSGYSLTQVGQLFSNHLLGLQVSSTNTTSIDASTATSTSTTFSSANTTQSQVTSTTTTSSTTQTATQFSTSQIINSTSTTSPSTTTMLNLTQSTSTATNMTQTVPIVTSTSTVTSTTSTSTTQSTSSQAANSTANTSTSTTVPILITTSTSTTTSSSTTQSSTQTPVGQTQTVTVTQFQQPPTVTSIVTVTQSLTQQAPTGQTQTVTINQSASPTTIISSVTITQSIIQTVTVMISSSVSSITSSSSTSTVTSTSSTSTISTQSFTITSTTTTSTTREICRGVRGCGGAFFFIPPEIASSWWVSMFLLLTGAWLGLRLPRYWTGGLAASSQLKHLFRTSSP